MYEIDPSDYEFQTCRKCGATNDPSLVSCRKCGTSLAKPDDFIIPIWLVVGAVAFIFLLSLIVVTGVVFEDGIFLVGLLVPAASILVIIGGFWLLIEAFKESILWGLACLFIPLASLAFLFVHPDRAFKPIAISILGVFLYFTATFFGPVSPF